MTRGGRRLKRCRVDVLFSDADGDLRDRRSWPIPAGGPERDHGHRYRGSLRRRGTIGRRKLVSGEVCDHINGNTLDCRRENLRLTDKFGNAQNRRGYGVSGHSGVSFHKNSGRWQAMVRRCGESHYLGLHDTVQAAASAVEKKRSEFDAKHSVPA